MESEKELCNRLMALAEAVGFISCPECYGWDIVLFRNRLVVGIQAKVKLSLHGVRQCLDNKNTDLRVLAFAEYAEKSLFDYLVILNELKIVPLFLGRNENNGQFENLMGGGFQIFSRKRLSYYRQYPKSVLEAPGYDFEIEAGISSPLTVNTLSINLCELEWHWRAVGKEPLTKDDITRHNIVLPKNKVFQFIPETGRYQFRDYYLPSERWPHIWRAVLSKKGDPKP
jgi:hypothetical protein